MTRTQIIAELRRAAMEFDPFASVELTALRLVKRHGLVQESLAGMENDACSWLFLLVAEAMEDA